MARISVLDPHQPITAKPSRTVKKTVALLLIRRCMAERITHNLIRMLAARATAQTLTALQVQPPAPRYIPVKMPPREVPGCYFQLPQSDTWKLEHRSVSFMHHA